MNKEEILKSCQQTIDIKNRIIKENINDGGIAYQTLRIVLKGEIEIYQWFIDRINGMDEPRGYEGD